MTKLLIMKSEERQINYDHGYEWKSSRRNSMQNRETSDFRREFSDADF